MDHIAKRDRIFQQLWEDAAAKYDKTITQTSHEMLVHVTAEKEDRVYVPYGESAAAFGKGKPAREEPFKQLAYRHIAYNNRSYSIDIGRPTFPLDYRFRMESIIWPKGGQILLPLESQAIYARKFYECAERELNGTGLVTHSDLCLNQMIQDKWVEPPGFGGWKQRQVFMTRKYGALIDGNTFYRKKQIRRQLQIRRLIWEYKRPYRPPKEVRELIKQGVLPPGTRHLPPK
ncbi:MAG: hypothetical protein GY737_17490, partial [Desulfobacteraceae bacterium]|nr:hypothetical protein [Desulfobacteraceae bacterium]